MTAAIKEHLDPELMHSMVTRSIPELREIYERILADVEKHAGGQAVDLARLRTRETNFLHFPQQKLLKVVKELAIYDKTLTSTKKIRFCFDKRYLDASSVTGNFIKSFPFGTRKCDRENW